nr:zinc ribbon domain-containing protein [Halorubrum xinjiangense]
MASRYIKNLDLHEHKFETFVSYKATWREIPTDTGDASHNSKTCSCCGERGSRQGRRFWYPNDGCDVVQDHTDRNASVNIAWREKVKLDDNNTNYRTHKTQPQVRLVRLSGSGRVIRPPSSRSLAEQGMLRTAEEIRKPRATAPEVVYREFEPIQAHLDLIVDRFRSPYCPVDLRENTLEEDQVRRTGPHANAPTSITTAYWRLLSSLSNSSIDISFLRSVWSSLAALSSRDNLAYF